MEIKCGYQVEELYVDKEGRLIALLTVYFGREMKLFFIVDGAKDTQDLTFSRVLR